MGFDFEQKKALANKLISTVLENLDEWILTNGEQLDRDALKLVDEIEEKVLESEK